jgi:hypothetical protein
MVHLLVVIKTKKDKIRALNYQGMLVMNRPYQLLVYVNGVNLLGENLK